ncbi:MAG: phage major capsid protein [Christensenella sp.]|nr:phage major capsid protein [Christensenella sp.]
MKTLAEVIARLEEIDTEVRSATSAEAVEKLETEKKELLERKAELEGLEQRKQSVIDIKAGAGKTIDQRGVEKEPDDKFDTLEYRKAFMEYCRTGKPIGAEYRLDSYTGIAEAAAMIPTTISNEIIKAMKVYGQLFNRVRKTNVKGGVRVPILSLKPTASRITEAAPSARGNINASTYVSFTYLGLECKIATSILADTVTLPAFEQQLVPLITEAMVKQQEIEIVKGNGTTEMLGVTVDSRVAAGQSITLSSAEFTQWDSWKKKVFAKIPLAYRAGGVLLMGAGTFDGYIDGMVDANGQPVGRTNYGISEGSQYRFAGKEVLEVEEDIVTSYDNASTGDVVAIYMVPGDYCINSNMQMAMYRWLDHDTNQWVDKALLINDGKLLDAAGVLLIKKGA